MANEGKRWEKNFKDSLPSLSITRLYDTTNGFAGIKNPCDFIVYSYPFQFMCELKSTKEKRLDLNSITDNQHEQLDFYNHIFGVTSLVVVEFRELQEAYAIPYNIVKQYKEEGKKSIPIKDLREVHKDYKLNVHYKRVNCKINEADFIDLLSRLGRVN